MYIYTYDMYIYILFIFINFLYSFYVDLEFEFMPSVYTYSESDWQGSVTVSLNNETQMSQDLTLIVFVATTDSGATGNILVP